MRLQPSIRLSCHFLGLLSVLKLLSLPSLLLGAIATQIPSESLAAAEGQQITLYLDDSVSYRGKVNRIALRDIELQLFINENEIARRGWALIEQTGPLWLPVDVTTALEWR